MKRKNKLLRKAVLGLLTIMMVLCFSYEAINAQDCRLIRIQANAPHEAVFVEPMITRISKGTCVIWINWVRAEEVRIVFEDGKKCDNVTDAPSGFDMDTENCYVTNYIPMGMTSSLRFNQEGTYEYVVKVKDGAQAKASIVVK